MSQTRPDKKPMHDSASPLTPAPSQPVASLRRLAVCATGICLSYCCYGLLQESLFTGVHLGPTFCLVTACVTNVIVALVWEWVETNVVVDVTDNKKNAGSPTPPPSFDVLPHKLLLTTSFCYVVAMTCSNEAIPLVSYPVAVLAKSCKLIPTMLVGQLLERKSYSQAEWLAALCISVGITMFQSSRWNNETHIDDNYNSQDDGDDDASSKRHKQVMGMTLLSISLLSDGLLSSCQNFIKRCSNRDARLQPPTAVQTMLYVNLYALVFLIPLAVLNGQLSLATIERVIWSDPMLSWNLLLLNTAAGVGQVFIFLTITWYTPVMCTTITTTRKFVTILLSVYAFGHAFSVRQWMSIALVFGGLYTVILVQHRKSQMQSSSQTKRLDKGAKEE